MNTSQLLSRVLVMVLALLVLRGCSRKQDNLPANAIVTTDAEAFAATRQAVDLCQRERSTSLTIPSAVPEDCLRAISKLTQLHTLELYKSTFVPEQSKILSSLVGLKRLRLEDVPLHDGSISFFSNLPDLEVLNVPATQLTDQGLQGLLVQLPRLQLLRIGSPAISDEGVSAFANAQNLRFLHLIDVPITDAGLIHFHSMPDLESLYIDGGKETDAGIRKLLKANPDLHFHRNQLHIAEDANADDH